MEATFRHDIRLAVDWGVKHQFKQTNNFQTCVSLFLFASMFSSHLSDVSLSLLLYSSVLVILKL